MMNYKSKQTSYDLAHEIATKAKKILGLSEYDQETLEHDINNLKAHEWIDLFNMIPDSNEVKKLYFTHCVELNKDNEQELEEDMESNKNLVEYYDEYDNWIPDVKKPKTIKGSDFEEFTDYYMTEDDFNYRCKYSVYKDEGDHIQVNYLAQEDMDEYGAFLLAGLVNKWMVANGFNARWIRVHAESRGYSDVYNLEFKSGRNVAIDDNCLSYYYEGYINDDVAGGGWSNKVKPAIDAIVKELRDYYLKNKKTVYSIEIYKGTSEAEGESFDYWDEDEVREFLEDYGFTEEEIKILLGEDEEDLDESLNKTYQITVKYHNEPNAKIEARSAKDRKDLEYQLNMDDEVEWYDFDEKQFNESYSKEGYSWDEVNGMIHIYEDGKLIDTYPDIESAKEAGWDLNILTEGLGLMKCDNCGSVYNSIPFGAYGMVKCFVCGGRTFNFLKDDKGMVGSSYNFKDSKERDIPADKVAESLNSRWKKMFGEPYKDSMSKATPQQLDDLKKRLLDTEKDKDEKQTPKEIAHESYSMQESTLTEDSDALADQKKKFAEYQEKLNEVNKKIEELLDKKRKYDSAKPEEKKQMDMIGVMDSVSSQLADYEQKQKHYMKEMELLDKQIKNNGENENPQVEDPKETGYGLAIFQNGKYVQGKVYKNSNEVNAVVNKVYKTKTGSGSLILVGIRPDKTLGTTIELKLGSHPSFNEIKQIQIPNDIKSQMNQVAKDLGFGGLKESLDQTREKALKMKESSNAFAILYGYRTKDGKEVELEPEEFATEEEYKDKIQQITNSFTKLSDKGPRGNRYGHEHNITFYTVYPDKKHVTESALDKLKSAHPNLDNTWNIGADKTQLNEKEFQLLHELANRLTENSPNKYKYEVKKTYEDFGAGMQWYTIVCYNKKGDSWQVLNTKEWLQLMNTGDVDAVYSEVISGDYFQDKILKESLAEMNHRQLMTYMDTLD